MTKAELPKGAGVLPCPFCGTPPKVQFDGESYYVECVSKLCKVGVRSLESTFEKVTVRWWNMRARGTVSRPSGELPVKRARRHRWKPIEGQGVSYCERCGMRSKQLKEPGPRGGVIYKYAYAAAGVDNFVVSERTPECTGG